MPIRSYVHAAPGVVAVLTAKDIPGENNCDPLVHLPPRPTAAAPRTSASRMTPSLSMATRSRSLTWYRAPTMAPSGRQSPLLETQGLVKRFGALVANDRVDLAVRAGEVHALLGENGAGKSTLVKILYGLLQPDAGHILWEGSRAVIARSEERRVGK